MMITLCVATSALMLPLAAAASSEDEEDTCPVCYESFSLRALTCCAAPVPCEVCKHAVCGECDTMLAQAGHERCPMCRAPQPRRSTHPLLPSLVHASLCSGATCERPRCNEAKLLLLRIAVHAHNNDCASRELSGPDECEQCMLWRGLLQSTRAPCAPSAVGPAAFLLQDGHDLQEATLAAVENVRPDPASLRARLLELPPAQVKRMLLTHMRWCRSRRCETCRKMRGHIRRSPSRSVARA